MPEKRPGIAVLALGGAGEVAERVVAAAPVEPQHLVEAAQAERVGVERVRVARPHPGALG